MRGKTSNKFAWKGIKRAQVKSRVAIEGYPAFLLLSQVSSGVLDRVGRNVRRIELREGDGDFLVDRHEASVFLPLEDLIVVASFFRPGAVAEGKVDKSAIGGGVRYRRWCSTYTSFPP